MHIEIAQAVEFLGRLLNTKLEQDAIARFKDKLSELLKIRFEDHWDPQQPYRGNGYRALSNFNGLLDPVVTSAALQANVDPNTIQTHLPRDFVLWIDPYSVSYRVGDHGNIMTLFEDRSRGRVTLKFDNSNNTTNTNTSTTATTTNNSSINAKSTASPSGSPFLQYLQQPKPSTPIRISPPNSPESIVLKQNQHQASKLSTTTTINTNAKNNSNNENKDLVIAT
ncbi:hypothetical protein BDF20DRAFT_915032 [Mycotypha africana]|uniref:uncharacterized protein n=1 Tax=Mycotypha africana TaxID=64632 RepID=UPI0023001136|nr:uncharacterized protein BDF20DRAFT_915032 [Mycotypha africana]KAI8973616.1 hypothetical protein BDF20DRAFT_915032 [Mycotypha africana]